MTIDDKNAIGIRLVDYQHCEIHEHFPFFIANLLCREPERRWTIMSWRNNESHEQAYQGCLTRAENRWLRNAR